MFVKRSTVENHGSCNFCNKGELNRWGDNFIYPYKRVFYLGGRSLGATICDECLDQLSRETDKIRATELADKLSGEIS